MNPFRRKPAPAREMPRPANFFSTDMGAVPEGRSYEEAIGRSIQIDPRKISVMNPDGSAATVAMDSVQDAKAFGPNSLAQQNVPDALAYWYGSQGFIGYQLAAIIAQNWLVDKACTMPARDAVRNGYEISLPEGEEVDPKKIIALKEADKRMRINDKMVEFVRMGRIFGIRIAMFVVESTDPLYYTKPFNIDAVKKGSYKGITQIDPYWITPELDMSAAANPMAPDFYEPTWWRINAVRVHRSHLVIMRTSEVADILKPSYFYGGVPVPQKIYERVYAAERTANEAPMLALTKRTTAIHTDLSQVQTNLEAFMEKINLWVHFRNNYGVKILGQEEEIQQFDTSLADLDAAIMTQYQIVAAAANVPATKLLGTTPKGFNATGEYEEASYHEELEAVQTSDLTPFLNRHHALLIRSEISPEAPFMVDVSWNALDAPTAKELAEINYIKAQTGNALTGSGAIDGLDERTRITLDRDSGYANLPEIDRELEPEDEETDKEAAVDE